MLIALIDVEKTREVVKERWTHILARVTLANPFIRGDYARSIIVNYIGMYDVPAYSLMLFEVRRVGAVVRPLSASKYYSAFNFVMNTVLSICPDCLIRDAPEERRKIETMLRRGIVIMPDGTVVRARNVRISELSRYLLLTLLRLINPAPVDSIPNSVISHLRSPGFIKVYTEGGRKWAFTKREHIPELLGVANIKVLTEIRRLYHIMSDTNQPISRRNIKVERAYSLLQSWRSLPVILHEDLLDEVDDIVKLWRDNPLKAEAKAKELLKAIDELLTNTAPSF